MTDDSSPTISVTVSSADLSEFSIEDVEVADEALSVTGLDQTVASTHQFDKMGTQR